MKRWLAVLAVLGVVALAPVAAMAGGVGGLNLSWTDCGTAGTLDKTFACNSNSGVPHIMVGSYSSPFNVDSLNGNEIVLDMTTDIPGVIPAWWQVKNYTDGTVGCRNGAASASFDFTGGPFTCNDYWGGQASGGFGILRNFGGTNRQRILVVCARGLSSASGVPQGLETYSFKITITNTKSTGTGSCADCLAKACIQLNSIELTQNPGVPPIYTHPITGLLTPNIYISNALNSSHVTFQGDPGGTFCASVPARNTTWGQVKNLYR